MSDAPVVGRSGAFGGRPARATIALRALGRLGRPAPAREIALASRVLSSKEAGRTLAALRQAGRVRLIERGVWAVS